MMIVLFPLANIDLENILSQHSGALTILIVSAMVMVALLILVPQMLRSQQRTLEMQHTERMKALEKGQTLSRLDLPSLAAGRTAYLVPMVVLIAAGTVTCTLGVCKADNLFAVTLTVWAVGGVVSLAAITGGVALLGRLAQFDLGEEEEVSENPLGK